VVFDTQPSDLTVFEGQQAQFTVAVGGATGYRWRKDGVSIFDGPLYGGAATATLTIFSCVESDEANYSCAIISPCGNAISGNGRLTVDQLPCPADYNQDGGIDGADVDAFFADWENGNSAADFNQDGGVDGADVSAFFAAWEAGSCD